MVNLQAYCCSNDEKLLIYDYINNGDRTAAIHEKSGIPFKPLLWPVRVQIMKGIAKGLAFLHEFSPKRYVHGNPKPNNILLDENMEPHISDFGLGRLANITDESPEFQKRDVYSFGVILLEMISGKLPSIHVGSSEIDLVEWIQLGIEERKPLSSIIDPSSAHCRVRKTI
ncbi:hypothetical protein V6N13_071983 [Hibiscus sabdariffa]|uniref:Protein kinase domain-containing protein n=1 Tax=Hibiscus sabdariffa TaxID=183260 RepID=A0ABR2TCJ7_9ROSI